MTVGYSGPMMNWDLVREFMSFTDVIAFCHARYSVENKVDGSGGIAFSEMAPLLIPIQRKNCVDFPLNRFAPEGDRRSGSIAGRYEYVPPIDTRKSA